MKNLLGEKNLAVKFKMYVFEFTSIKLKTLLCSLDKIDFIWVPNNKLKSKLQHEQVLIET